MFEPGGGRANVASNGKCLLSEQERGLEDDMAHARKRARRGFVPPQVPLKKCQLTVIRPVAPVILRVPLGGESQVESDSGGS